MKATTIRELKHDTGTVLSWVAEGESVQVTNRGKPVAVLSPTKRKMAVQRPDFTARLAAIYGDTLLSTTGTEVVADGRGET